MISIVISNPPVLEISHQSAVAWSKDFIVWEIKSTDMRVKKVKIVAEDMVIDATKTVPAIDLFPNLATPKEIVKEVAYVQSEPHPRGYALAWGLAPAVPNQKNGRSVDKYGVYGLDEYGAKVAERDPVIITDPPPIPGVEVPDVSVP